MAVSLRRFLGVSMLLVIALFAGVSAWAAGGRTHMEMGQYAWHLFLDAQSGEMLPGLDGLLKSDAEKRAYYTGCISPDWGYPTGDRDAGEACHWRPFHEQYLAFLKEKFPPPWDEAAQCQIAFFLGCLTHGVTDVAWQDTPGIQPPSMMDAIAEWDRQSPNAVDTVFDLYTYAACSLDVMLVGRHYWPYETIESVLQRCNLKYDRNKLLRGTNLMSLAYNAGTLGGVVAAFPYRNTYPIGRQRYVDYYNGGLINCGAAASMWIKCFYARLNSGWYFQRMPVYNWKPSGYEPYLGVADATLFSSLPDRNTGLEPVLTLTGDRADDRCATLIRADLSSVPPGATFKTAHLWLYFAERMGQPQTADKVIEAFRVNRPWGEGGGASDDVSGTTGATAKTGDATWKAATKDGASWTMPGCEAVPADREGTAEGRLVVQPTDGVSRWMSLDITAAVRFWVDHPGRNHGLLLRESDASHAQPGVLLFLSSEAHKCQSEGFCGGRRMAWRPSIVISQ